MKAAPGASRPVTAQATRWPAPAKLNLFLHVTARRADGYHELQTLFQLIDLADEHQHHACAMTAGSSVPRAPRGCRPKRTWWCAPPGRCRRRPARPWARPLRVTKRIPLGGGLGRRQLGCRHGAAGAEPAVGMWPVAGRAGRLGLPLGADVPVFVQGASAWAEGWGERLTPVELPRALVRGASTRGSHVSTAASVPEP